MSAQRAWPEPLAAAIFDMDGLLIDSEPLHFASLRALLATYDVDYDEALHETLVGLTDTQVFDIIRRNHPHLRTPTEQLVSERHARFLEIVDRPLDPQPGVHQALAHFAALGVPMAVASASHGEQVEACLTNMGIRAHFGVVVSGDQVERSKPDPMIYLETCRRLDVDPDGCVVFEDSGPGVTAGHRAGAYVIAIPCTATLGHDHSQADEKWTSLLDGDWANGSR